MTGPHRICLFGGGADTGNLGVAALTMGIVEPILARDPATLVTVFDHTPGRSTLRIPSGAGSFDVERWGSLWTRRVYRLDALRTMRHVARLRGFPGGPGKRLARCDAVIDVSGGDSFTDLYGAFRFDCICMTKEMTLELGKPLILAPQTYGPFQSDDTRRRASAIVRRAAMAWARDARSFETLRQLLGDAFDPERHRLGVDVAFGMKPQEPASEAIGALPFDAVRGAGRRVAGFNVSGLIWNNPEAARTRYGFRADYREVVVRFLTRLLEREDVELLLVPHVLAPRGHVESDEDACDAARAALPERLRSRAHVLRGVDTAPQVKWVIARCDWFCGTRMHATIAGLSSGVPTAAIAYSVKTAGVFETCSVGDAVVDPRELGTDEVVEGLWGIWQDRERHRSILSREAPGMAVRTADQMDRIFAACGFQTRP